MRESSFASIFLSLGGTPTISKALFIALREQFGYAFFMSIMSKMIGSGSSYLAASAINRDITNRASVDDLCGLNPHCSVAMTSLSSRCFDNLRAAMRATSLEIDCSKHMPR